MLNDQCQSLQIGFSRLINKLNQTEMNSNTVILLYGLREKEIDYFIKNELHISRDNYKIIHDGDFFGNISPNFFSGVMLLNKNKIYRWYPSFWDAVAQLDIKQKKFRYELSLKDSVLFDESIIPISNAAIFKVLNDTSMLAADTKYGNLLIYNTKNGSLIRSMEFNYNYMYLYELYLSEGDSNKVIFARRNKKLIAMLDQRVFKLYNLNIFKDKIYVDCGIMYSFKRDNSIDTSLYHFPFLLITDINLKEQNYVYVPFQDHKYYIDGKSLYTKDGKNFILSVEKAKDHQTPKYYYLAKYKYSEKENKLKWDSVLDIGLPDNLVKNHLFFLNHKLVFYNNNLYSYFDNVLPFLYNVADSSDIIQYPDSTYKTLPLSGYMYHTTKKRRKHKELVKSFRIIDVASTLMNDLAFVTLEDDKYYLSIMDVEVNNNIIYKKEIPYKLSGKFILTEKNLYIFKSTDQYSYLYKFQYLNMY